MSYFLVVLLVWNIAVMLVYGVDKLKARKGGRRISEASLVSAAIFLGGLGGLFGMVLFNHKTSKIKFRLLIPLAAIICIASVFCVAAIFGGEMP